MAADKLPRPNSPAYRSATGRLGLLTRRFGPDAPEVKQARVERDLAAIEERLSALVNSAPAPTAEQLDRLRRLPFGGCGGEDGEGSVRRAMEQVSAFMVGSPPFRG